MSAVTDLKSYLNKEVLIENNRGSKYLGTLVGFRDNCSRFCLADLVCNLEAEIVVMESKLDPK